MQSAIDTLTGLGISKDDIRTSRLSASQVTDPRNNSVITGYRATNSVQVTVRNLDRVGAIVDAVTSAGANRVDGVTFAVESQEAPKNQARAQAMQNARAKADQLASLAGVQVVGIKSIEESDASATPLRAQPQAMAPTAAAAAPAPPVQPGHPGNPDPGPGDLHRRVAASGVRPSPPYHGAPQSPRPPTPLPQVGEGRTSSLSPLACLRERAVERRRSREAPW